MDDASEASAYAEADFSAVNAAFVARLLELEPRKEPLRVLDAGCGPGDILRRVAAARPLWHCTGLDAAWAMLEFARRAAPGLSWVRGDAARTPFPDATFDVVVSNSILHHVAQPDTLWREIRRLLAPGACLLLRDLLRPESEAAAQQLVEQYAAGESQLLQEEFYRSFLAAYTLEEVRAQVAAAGLGRLEVAASSDRHLDVWGRV